MTTPPTVADRQKPPAAIVVGGWLLIQSAVLAWVAPARLWPHHPIPAQSLAVVEMVCLQIGFVALFCPMIDRWGTVAVLICGGAFFLQAAALLAAMPVVEAVRISVAVGIWIAAARFGNNLSQNAVLRLTLVAAILVPELLNFGILNRTALYESSDNPSLFNGPIEITLRQGERLATGDLAKLGIVGGLCGLGGAIFRQIAKRRSKVVPLPTTSA